MWSARKPKVSACLTHDIDIVCPSLEISVATLKSKNLLLIAPHFKTFIREQTIHVRPFFNSVDVIIPIPYFSKLTTNIPYVKRYFKFLKVIVESNGNINDCNVLASKYFTLPFGIMRKRNPFLAARSCVKTLSKINIHFNLTHAHFLENGLVGANLKELYGTPFVLTAHGTDAYDAPFRDRWNNNVARYVLSQADKIITVSHYNAKKLLSLGISSNKLFIISNGYDPKLFYPRSKMACRSCLGLSKSAKILLFVGNLLEEKGIFDLLLAFKSVSQKDGNLNLVIMGTGSSYEEIQKLVLANNIASKVLLVGGKPHSEVPLWMNACDLLVLPSYHEGFPTVVVEAMACGLPVLGTTVGGIPEALSEDYLGALFPPGDVQGLINQILTCTSSSYSRELIVNHSKQYEWPTLCSKTLSLYETLC
jgi:glycosyltransferase involved in cell wall biosynthesis